MKKFMGVPCPVCGKEFQEGDDIVVCPVCGAPHHRECYRKLGRCAYEERHASGEVWRSPIPEPEAAPQREGPDSEGRPYGAQQPQGEGSVPNYEGRYQQGAYQGAAGAQQRAPQMGVGLDDEIDGVPVRDVAQFIGQGAFYYLPRFKLFSVTQGKVFAPNFSAMFLSFFYYFYRKMYRLGVIFLGLFLLAILPNVFMIYKAFPTIMDSLLNSGSAQMDFSQFGSLMTASTVLYYVALSANLIAGLCANRIYFKFVMNRVKEIRTTYEGRPEQEYAQALAIQGRTNKIFVVAVIAFLFVAYIVFYIFLLSTYQIPLFQ